MPRSNASLMTLPSPRLDWALFLDVDGTLVDITESPHATRVATETLNVVDRLTTLLDGAVALVSGRPIRDVDRLFAPHRFTAAGVHGFEYRNRNGLIQISDATAMLDRARSAIEPLERASPGIIVEDKGVALTVHFRMAPEMEPFVRRVMNEIVSELGRDFHVQEGKMLLELKPTHRDKGRAIASFMEEPPFRSRLPVYLGDDVTDEDGFDTVNDLGGLSIRVGSGKNSKARYSIPTVHDVLEWLESVAVRLTEQRERG